MQVALIAMTILGCNDSIDDCQYIATAKEHWTTVALCDSASENVLGRYTNANYPMVIAVCQPQPGTGTQVAAQPPAADPKVTGEQPSVPAPPLTTAQGDSQEEAEHAGLAARALERVRSFLPTKDGVRLVFEKPVHVVADGYSWVVRKVSHP